MRVLKISMAAMLLVACGDDGDAVCVPGSTQPCVGVGACIGGQTCNADGTGFDPCRCAPDGGEPDDAGRREDGGRPDAGATDAGAEAGLEDGGATDGAAVDGARADGAISDGAAGDASDDDAGARDAGSPDCAPACASSERCCRGTCVNRTAPAGVDGRDDPSFSHCDGCGLACDADRASVCASPADGDPPRCLCGALPQCAAGEICVGDAGAFTCVDTSTDPDHCGGAGRACPEGESCIAGACECGSTGSSCPVGRGCCGGACLDLTIDPDHCGACERRCGLDAPVCADSTCRCGDGPACRAPVAPGPTGIGGDPGQSCCDGVCVENTASSCPCELVCEPDQECALPAGVLGPPPEDVCCTEDPRLGCARASLDGGAPFP